MKSKNVSLRRRMSFDTMVITVSTKCILTKGRFFYEIQNKISGKNGFEIIT